MRAICRPHTAHTHTCHPVLRRLPSVPLHGRWCVLVPPDTAAQRVEKSGRGIKNAEATAGNRQPASPVKLDDIGVAQANESHRPLLRVALGRRALCVQRFSLHCLRGSPRSRISRLPRARKKKQDPSTKMVFEDRTTTHQELFAPLLSPSHETLLSRHLLPLPLLLHLMHGGFILRTVTRP